MKKMTKVGDSKWSLVEDKETPADATTNERLQIAGINLARANARIRELEHEVSKWRWANELEPVIERMTPDEFALTQMLIAKLMGEGSTEHGPLNLATDERDLMKDAMDELGDGMSYLGMELLRLMRVWRMRFDKAQD